MPICLTNNMARATAIMCLLSVFGATPLSAKVYVEINEPTREPFPIAIPEFKDLGRGTHDSDLGKKLADLITADLQLTGLFRVLDRGMYIEDPQNAGLLPDQFDFSSWRQIDALGLVKGGYEIRTNSKVTVQLRIYDVLTSAQIGGKVYNGSALDIRLLAHRMASEIVYQFTGTRGFFLSKVVAVSNATGTKEIVVMDVDGHRLTFLTQNKAINILPTWSRNGNKIAYTSYKLGNPDLFIADLVKGVTRLASSYSGINSGADWSPNGPLLALTLSKDGAPDIYVIDENGREMRRVTNSFGVDSSPTWRPDGKKIAFVSSRAGGAHIFVANSDGSDIKRLTFHGTQNVSPSWAPKGDKIVFSGRDEGAFNVYLMNADGSGITQVTRDQGDNEDPSFSPDGNFLLFSSTRTNRKLAQLYISSLDGRWQVRITDAKASYTNPHWSPFVNW